MFRKLYAKLLGHPRYRWIVIAASVIYLVSPADISPDVIPILGWVDDGVVATMLATGITEVVLERRRALKAKQQQIQDGSASGEAAIAPGSQDPNQDIA